MKQRYAANVDRAHRALVAFLEQSGRWYAVLGQPLDALVMADYGLLLVEFKSEGEGKPGALRKRGTMRPRQVPFVRMCLKEGVPVAVVREVQALDAALRAPNIARGTAEEALREHEAMEARREARAKKRAARPKKSYRPPTTERRTCALPTCGVSRAKGSQWCVVHEEEIGIG